MKNYSFALIAFLALSTVNAQDWGEIHGNFQLDGQYYKSDSAIGAVVPDEQVALSGFGNLIYSKDRFTAGIRYETYTPSFVGYPAGASWTGTGIGYRFARYKTELLDVTIGNFYEQFGSGMVLRAWEDRGLGVDYALDGIRVKSQPTHGIYLTGLYGKQRFNFNDGLQNGTGIVRGFDAEVNLTELLDSVVSWNSQLILGGSFVSKFEENLNTVYDFPENVASSAVRLKYINKGFRLGGEYAYISPNPSAQNSRLRTIPDDMDPAVGLFQEGHGVNLNATYSQRGFGVSATASSLANMAFQSQRNAGPFDSYINYLPATSVQQTYLLAQLYPYATQPNGEVSFRGDLFFNIKRGSKIGGKYGTKIDISYTHIQAPDTTNINDLGNSRRGVQTSLFKTRDELYYTDFNIKVSRKLSKSFKASLLYMNIAYNNTIIQGAYDYNNVPVSGMVYGDLFVFEGDWKINSKNNLRFELQTMQTDQHLQDWAAIVLEYTVAPHWFISVVDQYNYGNAENKDYHFAVASMGYIKDSHRISLSYGRQRAGVFCVGGVCRVVPASNGLTLSITTSF